MQTKQFPEGFLWGTATAGHQIEGGNVASNWWAWEQLGLVDDGTTSGAACDYWNRYAEDHDLMVSLGQQAFRLGVEWSRLEPTDGTFDDEALAHYVAILADLQEKGLAVCLTLNHWVVPQWFTEQGSWLSATAVARWERFVRHVVPALAPHVDLWITLNEPMVPVLAGYLGGYHPPAESNPLHAAKVFRRLLEAHAVAYRVVHELVPRAPDGSPTQVGYAAAYQHVEAYHERGWQRPLEAAAARAVAWAGFDAWDAAVRTGRVPAPWGWHQRIDGLAGTYDFIGVNYYMRLSIKLHAKALSNVKSGEFDVPPGIETTGMGWQVYPPGFHAVLTKVAQRMDAPIYITENGCCDDTEDGDELRRRYLVSHLSQVHRAIADGADVRGYLLWSFMDNFEWREGFAKRFGIVAMDHDDPKLERRPRPSAHLMQAIIEANAITPEIVEAHAPGALDRWG